MTAQVDAKENFDASTSLEEIKIEFERGREATTIKLGENIIVLDSEWGRNTENNKPSLRICNDEVREKILALFPIQTAAETLFNRVIKHLKTELESNGSELDNYELCTYTKLTKRPKNGLRP